MDTTLIESQKLVSKDLKIDYLMKKLFVQQERFSFVIRDLARQLMIDPIDLIKMTEESHNEYFGYSLVGNETIGDIRITRYTETGGTDAIRVCDTQ